MKKNKFKLFGLLAVMFCLTGCGNKYDVYVTAGGSVISLSKDGSCTIYGYNDCKWQEQDDENIVINYQYDDRKVERKCQFHNGNLFCDRDYFEKK